MASWLVSGLNAISGSEAAAEPAAEPGGVAPAPAEGGGWGWGAVANIAAGATTVVSAVATGAQYVTPPALSAGQR